MGKLRSCQTKLFWIERYVSLIYIHRVIHIICAVLSMCIFVYLYVCVCMCVCVGGWVDVFAYVGCFV